ncbi:DUF1566 domain-containing protein [Stenotrophomonas sp. MMGLT7]|uniref:DUF1566 domain-containing protein n=1 Tax=Stenotrophomonas sp. MMGLT7 TaxID=2901227 RepID=UPI001E35219B|nr:DUF1566 domain-containing protein [Stenotrophomonas sp. MMGLT7]MCD7096905.1 DUF1566 domain-containing protein [Stenotrophomonas sp. MMGLT7]
MNTQTKTAPTSEQYFKVLADGSQVPASDPRIDHVAVLDTVRNLLIHPHSIGINGKAASGYRLKEENVVAQVDALGGGWRFADDEEAASIIRRDRYAPAVDPNLFPGIKPDWHLTSTPAAWAPASAAWWVVFGSGVVCGFDLDLGGWALAVRPAGQ